MLIELQKLAVICGADAVVDMEIMHGGRREGSSIGIVMARLIQRRRASPPVSWHLREHHRLELELPADERYQVKAAIFFLTFEEM
jgi:hypothetical protein